jgi:hypothetical protein
MDGGGRKKEKIKKKYVIIVNYLKFIHLGPPSVRVKHVGN